MQIKLIFLIVLIYLLKKPVCIICVICMRRVTPVRSHAKGSRFIILEI